MAHPGDSSAHGRRSPVWIRRLSVGHAPSPWRVPCPPNTIPTVPATTARNATSPLGPSLQLKKGVGVNTTIQLARRSLHVAFHYGRLLPTVARLMALVLLVLASTLAAITVQPPQAAVATVTFPGQQLLQVPFRWCAIKGSDGANNPMSVGEPTTNDYLWRRHERASDRVLIPGAMITGRSAFTAAQLGKSFPLIDDPIPPANGGPGALGDILSPVISTNEIQLAWAACDAAWDALTGPGVLVGFPAVNLHRFVNSDGSAASITGFGAASANWSGGGSVDLCTMPPTITAPTFIWAGKVSVSDYSLTRGFDPDDLVVAHEFGHAAGLDHGNGKDDNNNGRFDLKCDSAENINATPFSFMTAGANGNKTVTAEQRNHMRTILLRYSGTQIDPPAALVNADTISDQRTDVVQDVLDGDVDLASVAVAEIPITDTTVISHQLFGLIPVDQHEVENQYLFFADLDNDPGTGGNPADLGFTTEFTGAELVTRVIVDAALRTYPTVWIFENGALQEQNHDFFSEVMVQIGSENGEPMSHTVSLALPTSLRGPAAIPFRLQAIGEQLIGNQEFDILPNGSLSGARPISLIPPVFPVCAVEPSQPNPGDTVRVDITGLTPNEGAHVVLGDVLVSTGQTDGNGDASIEFALPGDTRSGPRLVTVGVDGTALTADCVINVPGENPQERDEQAFVGSWRFASTRSQGGGGDTFLTLHEDGTAIGIFPELGLGLGSWQPIDASSSSFMLIFPMQRGRMTSAQPLVGQGAIFLDANGVATISPITIEQGMAQGAPGPEGVTQP